MNVAKRTHAYLVVIQLYTDQHSRQGFVEFNLVLDQSQYYLYSYLQRLILKSIY